MEKCDNNQKATPFDQNGGMYLPFSNWSPMMMMLTILAPYMYTSRSAEATRPTFFPHSMVIPLEYVLLPVVMATFAIATMEAPINIRMN